MDEQPVGRIWACKKKYTPNPDFFITENKNYARDARNMGYRCERLHNMEKAVFGRTVIRHRRKRRRRKN